VRSAIGTSDPGIPRIRHSTVGIAIEEEDAHGTEPFPGAGACRTVVARGVVDVRIADTAGPTPWSDEEAHRTQNPAFVVTDATTTT